VLVIEQAISVRRHVQYHAQVPALRCS
jgi:hypothetical protein